jgi:hypothetical protein
MIGRRAAGCIAVLWIVGDLVERRLVHHLPGAIVEHQKIDRLREAGAALGLSIEGQAPEVDFRRITVVDLAPEMVVLTKAIDAPVEVAEDHEWH